MDLNVIFRKPNWIRRRWNVVCASTVFLLVVGTAIRIVGAEAEGPDIRRDATVVAVEQVMPSVVNIATRTLVRDAQARLWRQASGLPESIISLGSGVIIDEAGYLLTNEHVVRDVDQIGVQFNAGTNVYYEATVVAKDQNRDVALLKLKAQPNEKFHAIKFAGEDDLLLGETVLALGNPYGLGGSVTRGILSSKSRGIPKEGRPLDFRNWLQTDAPINPGNSGGPLVNLRGELIGINVQTVNVVGSEPAQGLGFAIPIKLVEEALTDIFPGEYVKSLWFGVRVKVGTSPLAISTVQPGSPADRAGLKPGDIIVQVNGREPKSFMDFADLLASNIRSNNVSLTFQRGSARNTVPVHLVPVESVFNADMVRQKLGLTLERRTLQFPGGTLKVFAVTAVEKDSPAEAAQLRSGVFITAVDDEFPDDVEAMAKLLYGTRKGETVQLRLLDVLQQGATTFTRAWQAELRAR